MNTLYRSVLASLLIVMLSGCATQAIMRGAAGGHAILTFWQNSPHGDGTHFLWWRESPVFAESMLPIPSLAGCSRPVLYVNPDGRGRNKIDGKTVSVAPIALEYHDEVSHLWSYIDGDPCAVLVYAGQIEEGSFTGVMLLTNERVISELPAKLTGDQEADTGRLMMMPLTILIYDVPFTLLGGSLATGAAMREIDAFSEPVAITFVLPDQTRYSTHINVKEARRLLKETNYVENQPLSYADWEVARFWTRAALIKLRLSFREQSQPETWDTGGPQFPELKHVAGVSGLWVYRIPGDSVERVNLSDSLGDHFKKMRELTFSLRYKTIY